MPLISVEESLQHSHCDSSFVWIDSWRAIRAARRSLARAVGGSSMQIAVALFMVQLDIQLLGKSMLELQQQENCQPNNGPHIGARSEHITCHNRDTISSSPICEKSWHSVSHTGKAAAQSGALQATLSRMLLVLEGSN